MKKILVISGPTATGKTALAVKVADKINSELVSADSRQVYLGLDIGVGKDHPRGTPINLIDITTPDKTFSVSQFHTLAFEKINHLHSQGKLPIIVGCSGFYIDSILNSNYSTFAVEPNIYLRFALDHLSVGVLQTILRLVDPSVYSKLNNSDINNTRRLIRKIEIKTSRKRPEPKALTQFDILHISLTAPNSFLYPRIDSRVEERLKTGHLSELDQLLKQYSWSDPGLKVSCYQVFKKYYQGIISVNEATQLWKFAEHSDARHQKTWYSRYKQATFVDISKKNSSTIVLNKILKWYNQL